MRFFFLFVLFSQFAWARDQVFEAIKVREETAEALQNLVGDLNLLDPNLRIIVPQALGEPSTQQVKEIIPTLAEYGRDLTKAEREKLAASVKHALDQNNVLLDDLTFVGAVRERDEMDKKVNQLRDQIDARRKSLQPFQSAALEVRFLNDLYSILESKQSAWREKLNARDKAASTLDLVAYLHSVRAIDARFRIFEAEQRVISGTSAPATPSVQTAQTHGSELKMPPVRTTGQRQ